MRKTFNQIIEHQSFEKPEQALSGPKGPFRAQRVGRGFREPCRSRRLSSSRRGSPSRSGSSPRTPSMNLSQMATGSAERGARPAPSALGQTPDGRAKERLRLGRALSGREKKFRAGRGSFEPGKGALPNRNRLCVAVGGRPRGPLPTLLPPFAWGAATRSARNGLGPSGRIPDRSGTRPLDASPLLIPSQGAPFGGGGLRPPSLVF